MIYKLENSGSPREEIKSNILHYKDKVFNAFVRLTVRTQPKPKLKPKDHKLYYALR